MRLVLDTNIFISGIFWEGNFCSLIIDKWKNKEFELIISLDVIEELIKTLKSFKIMMPEEIILQWQNLILENSIIIEPFEKIFVIKEDFDDNKFLECAVEGSADYIISQDNHLLNLKEFQGIKIVTPEEFLKIFENYNL
jgi:uncharacterized protein